MYFSFCLTFHLRNHSEYSPSNQFYCLGETTVTSRETAALFTLMYAFMVAANIQTATDVWAGGNISSLHNAKLKWATQVYGNPLKGL